MVNCVQHEFYYCDMEWGCIQHTCEVTPLRHGHRKRDRQPRKIDDWSAVLKGFRPISKKRRLAQIDASKAMTSLATESSDER